MEMDHRAPWLCCVAIGTLVLEGQDIHPVPSKTANLGQTDFSGHSPTT